MREINKKQVVFAREFVDSITNKQFVQQYKGVSIIRFHNKKKQNIEFWFNNDGTMSVYLNHINNNRLEGIEVQYIRQPI